QRYSSSHSMSVHVLPQRSRKRRGATVSPGTLICRQRSHCSRSAMRHLRRDARCLGEFPAVIVPELIQRLVRVRVIPPRPLEYLPRQLAALDARRQLDAAASTDRIARLVDVATPPAAQLALKLLGEGVGVPAALIELVAGAITTGDAVVAEPDATQHARVRARRCHKSLMTAGGELTN